MMSKCSGNAVWGLLSTFTFCYYSLSATVFSTIKEGVQDWFPHFSMVKIVSHVLAWSKLLTTLIPYCLCYSDSIPSRTFLCFNPLSLAIISALPPVNTTLALTMVCPSVFQPIECFLYEGLQLQVWLCPWVLSLGGLKQFSALSKT